MKLQECDGSPVSLSPRAVLRRVIDLYHQRGWRPVVAPEMEFFLVARQQNPHEPLQPPVGRTGKVGRSRVSFQAHRARDRTAPRHLCHLYGQADGGRARQCHAHPSKPA